VRIVFLLALCVFVAGHLELCVANRFAHHPPKIQLNVAHVLLHEIEIVGPSNVKGLTIEVGVENPALSAGEGVDCNLPIRGQQVISIPIRRAHRIDHVPLFWLRGPSMSHGRYHETQNAEQLSSTNLIVGNDAFNQRACKMWFQS
jgi:hypothetical protein